MIDVEKLRALYGEVQAKQQSKVLMDREPIDYLPPGFVLKDGHVYEEGGRLAMVIPESIGVRYEEIWHMLMEVRGGKFVRRRDV